MPSRRPRPRQPLRIAFTADFGGTLPMDRETAAICAREVRRFEALGIAVEEAHPDLGALNEAFLVLRSQHFVVDREELLATHRDKLKPDIVWQTERGLAETPSRLAWAEHERARFFRAMRDIFARCDVLVTPGASTPAFDVMLRAPEKIAGKVLENYMGGSLINAFATLAGCPAVAVPCGFDQYGRPVGLQVVAPPRAGCARAAGGRAVRDDERARPDAADRPAAGRGAALRVRTRRRSSPAGGRARLPTAAARAAPRHHFSISVWTKARISSGVFDTISAPSVRCRSTTVGLRSAARMSALSFASTGARQVGGRDDHAPGRGLEARQEAPRRSSARRAAAALRRAPVVASAFSAPDWMCGSAAGTVSNMMFTRLAIRSGCAWVLPR